jgi:hypothetical protein
MNDDNQMISLAVDVDEGKQFFICTRMSVQEPLLSHLISATALFSRIRGTARQFRAPIFDRWLQS